MYRRVLKRILDIIIAIILFLPVIMISFVFGFFIKIEDNGPIFYCAPRLGVNRKVYKMYKLRTMKVNAPDIRNEDGSTFNSDNDPRLLKIGKFLRKSSIDEMPQIINVIKGDMSFIGPRPDLESQAILYDNLNKDLTKFEVRPGITGYAQCNGRNILDWDKKLELDHYYVDHCSLFLDLKIIFKTVKTILFREGVNKYE